MINLKLARLKKGYTQHDLSKLTKINVRSITSYECGKSNPSLEKLCKIADVLNVTTDYLLERE